MQSRLERDPANKMVGGVCAGLAHYLQIDVTLVRLFFVASTILWGFGAHVVKVGLAPLVVDLMQRGFVSGLLVRRRLDHLDLIAVLKTRE